MPPNKTECGNHLVLNISDSTIVGNHNKITGDNNEICGNHNEINGNNCSVIGNHNRIVGMAKNVVGNGNTTTQSCSRSTGPYSTIPQKRMNNASTTTNLGIGGNGNTNNVIISSGVPGSSGISGNNNVGNVIINGNRISSNHGTTTNTIRYSNINDHITSNNLGLFSNSGTGNTTIRINGLTTRQFDSNGNLMVEYDHSKKKDVCELIGFSKDFHDSDAKEDERTCCICMVNRACCVVNPCGHSEYCYTCIKRLIDDKKTKCPTCNAIFKGGCKVII